MLVLCTIWGGIYLKWTEITFVWLIFNLHSELNYFFWETWLFTWRFGKKSLDLAKSSLVEFALVSLKIAYRFLPKLAYNLHWRGSCGQHMKKMHVWWPCSIHVWTCIFYVNEIIKFQLWKSLIEILSWKWIFYSVLHMNTVLWRNLRRDTQIKYTSKFDEIKRRTWTWGFWTWKKNASYICGWTDKSVGHYWFNERRMGQHISYRTETRKRLWEGLTSVGPRYFSYTSRLVVQRRASKSGRDVIRWRRRRYSMRGVARLCELLWRQNDAIRGKWWSRVRSRMERRAWLLGSIMRGPRVEERALAIRVLWSECEWHLSNIR